MIKNIIFDLGNVILKLNWDNVLNKYSHNDDDRKILKKVIFESQEWLDLDEGIISKTEGINRMISNLPVHLHEACLNIMNNWTDSLDHNIPMLDFVEDIRRKGFKTYILSNAPLDIPVYLKEADLEKYFDGKIISAEELIVKPDHKIYELILERYSLNASESIFIDDRKVNIEAAIECGLNGIIYDYKDHDGFLNIIKNKVI